MSHVSDSDQIDRLRNVRAEFEALLETFPIEVQPSIIRSYERDDFDSPGFLSLAALPFWVGDKLGLPHQICQKMAVGNLFLLHLFQSFDFIVDGDRPDTSIRSQTVLGNLCYLQVLNHYNPYFPADSPFWERMKVYWREWGESVLWEVERDETRRPFLESYLLRSAHKAAALKICPTGLALLAERYDLIDSIEDAIDWMHATMQLVDDLKDWREDLEHRRYNSFLGLMVSNENIPADLALTPMKVSASIFGSDILDKYLGIVKDFALKAEKATSDLEIEPWTELVRAVVRDASSWVEMQNQRMVVYLMNQLVPGTLTETFERKPGTHAD